MKPCPSFNQTSSLGCACFWCAAVKLPSATNPQVYFQFSGSWGFVFQSSGRLTPGCGQVGQKKTISPGIGAVPLCPNPKVANSLRLRYCLQPWSTRGTGSVKTFVIRVYPPQLNNIPEWNWEMQSWWFFSIWSSSEWPTFCIQDFPEGSRPAVGR